MTNRRVELGMVCENCTFWDDITGSDLPYPIGQCRRRAPDPLYEEGAETYWPVTQPREWCGEFVRVGAEKLLAGEPPVIYCKTTTKEAIEAGIDMICDEGFVLPPGPREESDALREKKYDQLLKSLEQSNALLADAADYLPHVDPEHAPEELLMTTIKNHLRATL